MTPLLRRRRQLDFKSFAAVGPKTLMMLHGRQSNRVAVELFPETVRKQITQRIWMAYVSSHGVGVPLPTVSSFHFNTDRERIDRFFSFVRVQPPEIDAENHDLRCGLGRQSIEKRVQIFDRMNDPAAIIKTWRLPPEHLGAELHHARRAEHENFRVPPQDLQIFIAKRSLIERAAREKGMRISFLKTNHAVQR